MVVVVVVVNVCWLRRHLCVGSHVAATTLASLSSMVLGSGGGRVVVKLHYVVMMAAMVH